MVHHFATKGTGKSKRRYRYYVCLRAQKEGWAACPGPSLPATDLEKFVIEQIRSVVTQDAAVNTVTQRAIEVLAESSPDLVIDPDEVVGAFEAFDPLLDAMTHGEREALIRGLVTQVDWDAEAGTVSVTFREALEEAAA